MQTLSVRWCAGAVERYEARQVTRFSLVVFARPDLVWWQPFKPWCSWPQGAVLTCESPGCDVAWAAPRAHLARMGRQHLFRRDCPNSRQTRSRVEFPSCCGAPERLLSYAVHVGREALDVPAARRLKGQALLRVPEGMFVPGMNNRNMNIMRSLHVCGMNTNNSTDQLADVRAGRCRAAAAPRGVGYGLGQASAMGVLGHWAIGALGTLGHWAIGAVGQLGSGAVGHCMGSQRSVHYSVNACIWQVPDRVRCRA